MTTAGVPSSATNFVETDGRELVPQESVLWHFIWVNPARMSGEPCFKGTRVPVKTLFEYLSAGESLEMFLDGFPNVKREQAVAVLDLAQMGLLQGLRHL